MRVLKTHVVPTRSETPPNLRVRGQSCSEDCKLLADHASCRGTCIEESRPSVPTCRQLFSTISTICFIEYHVCCRLARFALLENGVCRTCTEWGIALIVLFRGANCSSYSATYFQELRAGVTNHGVWGDYGLGNGHGRISRGRCRFCLLNHPFVQGVSGQGFSFSDLGTSFAHEGSFFSCS